MNPGFCIISHKNVELLQKISKKKSAVEKSKYVTGNSSKCRLPGFELLDGIGTSTSREEYHLWKSHKNQQGWGLPVLPQT